LISCASFCKNSEQAENSYNGTFIHGFYFLLKIEGFNLS